MTWVDILVVGIVFVTAVLNLASTRSHTGPLRDFVVAANTNKETAETLVASFEKAVSQQSKNVTQTLQVMKSQNKLHNKTVRESIKSLNQTTERITKVMGLMLDRLR